MSKSFGVESIINRLIVTVLCLGICAPPAFSQGDGPQVNRDPENDTINPKQKAYGNEHEARLWREFQTEMGGASVKNWMYNAAKDKRQAIRDILEIKDFPAFLEKSGYAEKFGK